MYSYFFCKTVRAVVSFLRENSIRIVPYVDDFLIMCEERVFTDHVDFVLHTLCELGFTINLEKSILEGRHVIPFIGFNIHTDTDYPWIDVPSNRIYKLRKDIRYCLKKGTIKARFLARIAGQCISMCKAVLPGKLLLRNIYRLLTTRCSWDDILCIDSHSHRDLCWWLTALKTWNKAPLRIIVPDLQIETDASGSGWGAICGNAEASGIWSAEMSMMPSNYRELMAVHMAVLSFKDLLKDKCVQVLTDNITTVAYLNHLGGHCMELSNLAQSIWCTTNSLGITLKAKHLAGNLNLHADRLSRLTAQYEWMLHPRLFQCIDHKWGPHTIDRFASFLTHQTRRYNTLFHDPMSTGVDALAQTQWDAENNFVNPPFRLIPLILTKMCAEKAKGTIIAPWWPSQPWFQKLLHMTIATPFRIPNSPNSFIHWGHHVIEPLKNRKWKIFAFRICGMKGCKMMDGTT